jgi:argininosuccinate lyase
VPAAVHNTPFGDIVDTEDDLQPLVATAFKDATRAVALVAAAMATAEFDVARMRARATESWVTVTELADTLARDHGVPFKAGHAIASKLIAARTARPAAPLADLLANVSREVTGREIKMSADVLAKVLSPEHFIAVRKTPGGPAPEITATAIAAARRRLADDSVEVGRRREGLASADVRRRQAVDAI